VSIAATIGVSSTSAPPSSSSSNSAATTTRPNASFSTSTTISISSSASTATSTNSQPDQEGLSSGAKIGVGVTIPLVAILISATIGFWIRHRRRHQYSTKSLSQGASPYLPELPVSEAPQELAEKRGPGSLQYEMEGDPPPVAELAAERYSRGNLPSMNRYSSR
jgi:hypothetical protein